MEFQICNNWIFVKTFHENIKLIISRGNSKVLLSIRSYHSDPLYWLFELVEIQPLFSPLFFPKQVKRLNWTKLWEKYNQFWREKIYLVCLLLFHCMDKTRGRCQDLADIWYFSQFQRLQLVVANLNTYSKTKNRKYFCKEGTLYCL